ncbi:hypothetical protein LTR94_029837, partial [Friedmanniomyces endolithicus]
MGTGKIMIATSLAATLAVLAPTPQFGAPSQPVPYAAAPQSPLPLGATPQARVLNDQDTALFRQGLAAARSRDVRTAQTIAAQISDPSAKKLVEWALVDTSADQLAFSELSRAGSELAGWPRAESRRAATEKSLDRMGGPATAALALFSDTPPETVEGAIAFAAALEQQGQQDRARSLIKDWWRTRSFDEAPQSRILARWGGWLNASDHEARLNLLLIGPHGPATRSM